MDSAVPLSYEASAGDTHKQTTATLPEEVVKCLGNARFMHLATCADNIPQVSLMNYTYVPSSTYSNSPVIVMTANPASKKMNNLLKNPNVSLLIHDWSTYRTSTSGRRLSGGSPEPPRSSLASLLYNLNSAAVSQISATISGVAQILDRGSEQESFYRDQHVENNTFDTQTGGEAAPLGQPEAAAASSVNGTQAGQEAADPSKSCFIAGEEVRVIVVKIRNVRISDWKGGVRDYVITSEGSGEPQAHVNGVS